MKNSRKNIQKKVFSKSIFDQQQTLSNYYPGMGYTRWGINHSRILNSILRLICLFSSESFGLIGFFEPYPICATRGRAIPFDKK